MQRLLIALFVFTATGLDSAEVIAQQGRANASATGWSSNYQESLARARRLDKPLMIVFRCIP